MNTNALLEFFIGTYTGGSSEGIYHCTLSDEGKFGELFLAARCADPSFLCSGADNRILLAVNELDEGGLGYVQSYDVRERNLREISRQPSGGAHPCHINCNEDGFVVASNYTGGNIALYKLLDDGKLSELLDVQHHEGSGTHRRQDKAYAHSTYFLYRDNKIISADLGSNELYISSIQQDSDKFGEVQQKISLAPGAGPRHIAFHPNKKWMYIANELDSSVSLFEVTADGKYIQKQNHPTLPNDFTDDNLCAEICLSADGKFLYISNRGHDSICIFTVDTSSGELTLVDHPPSASEQPRHFAISPDQNFLVVAHQSGNCLCAFKRDTDTGRLQYSDRIEIDSAVCILFK